jgi:succinate dehydrogenase / fumarate reductase, flavoprotein subunit
VPLLGGELSPRCGRSSPARATLEAALAHRGTRSAHNRSDYPAMDDRLGVNLLCSSSRCLAREPIPPVPGEIAGLMHDVSPAGNLVE